MAHPSTQPNDEEIERLAPTQLSTLLLPALFMNGVALTTNVLQQTKSIVAFVL
jgi:hypothetical protein